MATEKIIMPQLGESITEGTISKWLISVGDHVNKYDPLVEVMTDKVSAEVPSSFEGVIKTLIANEGETLAVGEAICEIETEEVVETLQTKTNAEVINKEVEKDEQKVLSTDQTGKSSLFTCGIEIITRAWNRFESGKRYRDGWSNYPKRYFEDRRIR